MRRATRDEDGMAALAARQYGVVTRAQLNAAGHPDAAIERAVASGRLHAWPRGIFAAGHGRLSPHGLCMAAILFRGDGALVSHQSAIWLWGLERKLEIPVQVSVRRPGHAEGAIGLHHCPTLRDEDVTRTERLPVTAVPRTLLDHASTAETLRLARAIGRADRLGLLDAEAVGRLADEVDGHRGRGRLLRAMRLYREGLTKPARAPRERTRGRAA